MSVLFLAFTDQSPVCNYYDATSPDGKVAALVGLIGGKHALYWSGKSFQDRKKAILGNEKGVPFELPIISLKTNWLRCLDLRREIRFIMLRKIGWTSRTKEAGTWPSWPQEFSGTAVRKF